MKASFSVLYTALETWGNAAIKNRGSARIFPQGRNEKFDLGLLYVRTQLNSGTGGVGRVSGVKWDSDFGHTWASDQNSTKYAPSPIFILEKFSIGIGTSLLFEKSTQAPMYSI